MTPSITSLLVAALATSMNSQPQQHHHHHHDPSQSSSSSSLPTTGGVGEEGMMATTCQRLVDKLRPKLQLNNDNKDGAIGSQQQYWIGCAGGPGAGKTTIAETVAKQLNTIAAQKSPQEDDSDDDDSAVAIVIPMDGWHYTQERLLQLHGHDYGMMRRGAPWTFDVQQCYTDLSLAKINGEGNLPSYSRDISDPIPDGVQLRKHHQIVIVEGIYLLHKKKDTTSTTTTIDDGSDGNIGSSGWNTLWNLWDETWFVKCPTREIQVERLVQRSLRTWSESKAKVWGLGEVGARKRAEFNDVKNMDIVQYCEELADEVIVTY